MSAEIMESVSVRQRYVESMFGFIASMAFAVILAFSVILMHAEIVQRNGFGGTVLFYLIIVPVIVTLIYAVFFYRREVKKYGKLHKAGIPLVHEPKLT